MIELDYVSPSLQALDERATEVIVGSLWQNRRPLEGVAALYDWRSAGRVSKILKSGFLEGRLGEVILMTAKPGMNADKLLLFGLGAYDQFEEQHFEQIMDTISKTLEGLRSTHVTIELPGRQTDRVDAISATEALMKRIDAGLSVRQWALIETDDTKRAIEQHLQQTRRNPRRET